MQYRLSAVPGNNYMRTELGNTYTYIHSYLGFNVAQAENSNQWGVEWRMGTDSNGQVGNGNNAGSMILGGALGELMFVTIPTVDPHIPRIFGDAYVQSNIKMVLNRNGQLRVGLHNPVAHPDYKLAVEGKLVTQYIYVTQPNTWADFVFAPGYRLLPLPELESYLHRNRHLPALPPAAEVTANGYSVTDMDARLLQTIEELTLRVIELDKQVKALRAQQAPPAAAGH